MNASHHLWMIAFAATCASCAPGLPARTVSLRMHGERPLAEAQVTIDDQMIGPLGFVAVRGVALPPGPHRITVEKPGYFPWDKTVVATDPDKPISLDVVLVPIPD
jgi:PEGA domain